MSDFPYTDPPSEPKSCDYCGTMVDEDDVEVSSGERHYAAKCREYVYTVLQTYKQDLVRSRADVARLREELAIAMATIHDGMDAYDCDGDAEKVRDDFGAWYNRAEAVLDRIAPGWENVDRAALKESES